MSKTKEEFINKWESLLDEKSMENTLICIGAMMNKINLEYVVVLCITGNEEEIREFEKDMCSVANVRQKNLEDIYKWDCENRDPYVVRKRMLHTYSQYKNIDAHADYRLDFDYIFIDSMIIDFIKNEKTRLTYKDWIEGYVKTEEENFGYRNLIVVAEYGEFDELVRCHPEIKFVEILLKHK